MRILFIGDIVGRPGRDIVFANLARLKAEEKIDLTIVNGENSAHGKGITQKIYRQFLENGVDFITLGNHAFSKKEIIPLLPDLDRLIVPFNNPEGLGIGARIYDNGKIRLCIANILGEVFMNPPAFSPFKAMDKIMETYPDCSYFVDFHGEATSEKELFAHYYASKLLVCVGTHTHVQTADERLIKNCAYISDVGMCGAYDSIIGRDIDEVIAARIQEEKTHFKVAVGPAELNAVVIEIDESTKKASSIKRIQIRPESSQ